MYLYVQQVTGLASDYSKSFLDSVERAEVFMLRQVTAREFFAAELGIGMYVLS